MSAEPNDDASPADPEPKEPEGESSAPKADPIPPPVPPTAHAVSRPEPGPQADPEPKQPERESSTPRTEPAPPPVPPAARAESSPEPGSPAHPGDAIPPRPGGQAPAWVWAGQNRPASRHTTTTLVLSILVAALVGMIVGAGAVGAVWDARSDVPASPDAPGDQESPGDDEESPDENEEDGTGTDEEISAQARPAEEVLPEELDQLTAFIENERGLEFTDEVDVRFLDDEEFTAAWFAPAPGSAPAAPQGPADYGATFTALGLTTSPDDFYAAEHSSSIDGLMGFYDPWNSELVVRGTTWEPLVEGTVVHELAHALQDQHFDLTGLLSGTGPEGALPARALVEGDASRVEYAYIAAQPQEWQDEYQAAWQDFSPTGPWDPLLDMMGSLPYWLGDRAMTLLLIEGNEQVDAALSAPPSTTAEVVEITDFVDGETPEIELPEPPVPPNGAEVIDEGTLGVGFLELLHLDVQIDWFGNEYLDGWLGDSYTTWASESGACTSAVIKLEAEAVAAAEDYFKPWADRTGGTVGTRPGTSELVLSSCAQW